MVTFEKKNVKSKNSKKYPMVLTGVFLRWSKN
jgi:hypothetical protein